MYQRLLGHGHARRPVTALAFPPLEFGRGAAHPDEHDPEVRHDRQAVVLAAGTAKVPAPSVVVGTEPGTTSSSLRKSITVRTPASKADCWPAG